MSELVKYIHDEWVTVSQAPFTITTLILLLTAVIWKVIDWKYSVRHESLNGRLELAKSTADEYKRKLDGASPDEAKTKIETLEARLSQLENEMREASEVDYVKIFNDNLRNATFNVDGGREP